MAIEGQTNDGGNRSDAQDRTGAGLRGTWSDRQKGRSCACCLIVYDDVTSIFNGHHSVAQNGNGSVAR